MITYSYAVHLKPELEAIIHRDVERGLYQCADEFVARAVQLLHDQEEWFADNESDLLARVQAGIASAERGDLLEPGDVKAQLAERKREFLNTSKR